MRIVDVSGFYAPCGGGVKTYVDQKLRMASRYGHEMIAVVPGAEEGIEPRGEGGTVITLAGPAFPFDTRYHYFPDQGRLHAELDRLRPDMVECGTPWLSPGMVARWPGAAPRALIMHQDVFATYPYRWLGGMMSHQTIDRSFDWFWRHLRRLGEAYDLVVCANHDLGARLSAGGVANVVVEPMGVEPGRFSPALRDERLRARMLEYCDLGPKATLLLGVGRHSPEKRWAMVSRAVTAAGFGHDIGLLLLGEGRHTARIERVIAGNPHIRLLDHIADRTALAPLLASVDALVHGCEAETFGMVGAEARASGVPVIVPDCGGMADFARDGGGWRYAAADAADLAALLRRIVPDELAAARLRTTAMAAQVRSMDTHFSALFGRYEGLVSGPRYARAS